MSYEPISEWTTNDGTVPSDINADTILETKYRDGKLGLFNPSSNIANSKDNYIWEIFSDDCDIIQYRKMKRIENV